ncbi:hypothetical protein K443DRAFT_682452 [Laccaria amethystina LaAM-08-1]|uniref:Mitochondrial import inner membrane translocase subunit TIM50 n=1 Tax=Laccaria amethystina LaAM-08-1 TaxID=1095629 RepID=A0A0C9WV14_9AGAR|nr:hypothetical protein K443DRAFT_682452 [Laccaria amethystina LaAM-08-1]
MRRMSPDYSGNAYEHSRGLSYDYNYDPSNRDSPSKAGKLDPYSDDYSIPPPKSPPRRSRSPDAYSTVGSSTRRPDRSRKEVASVGRRPMPGIPESPTQSASLERSNKLTSSPSSSKRDSPDKIGKFDPGYSIPSKSPPRSSRSPSSRRPERSGKEVERRPTPPPPIPVSPTLEYLRTSLEPSNTLASPSASRKLLILDLNGTLVFRSPHRRDYYHHANHYTPRPLRSVFPRPYFPSFRNYLFHPTTRTWLDTMVWSSAQPHSVADMVDKCFGERKEELVAVWARDTLGLDEQAYNRKSQTTKDLAKPWSALQLDSATATTPSEHSALTTILVDDSPLKAKLQPYNHLCVREYVSNMRGSDVAVRDAEVLAARAEEQSQSTHASREVEDEDVNAEEDPGITKKRKRKARKKEKMEKKWAEKKAWVANEQARAVDGGYDEMLLAVVGILEEVKVQGNVAGWMRGGGLMMLGREVDSSAKKRRLSDGAEFSDSPGTPPPPPPQSSSQPLLEEADVTSITTGIPMNNTEETTSIWFEDQELVEWWADKGRVALDGLGIDIVSGVVGTYDG